MVSAMVVGKDVLELVSKGMYIDPMAMIREYVQNAVDSIDEATLKKKYKEIPAEIEFILDDTERSMVIRDNGIGVGKEQFERCMLSIGASQKIETNARGFRGVGRFAGLSYCRELIFRSSTAGEKTVSEIMWDGQKFKKLVNDRSYQGELSEFLKEIAEVSFDESAKITEHYFEVELRGVVRYKNDMLLNEEEIYSYLAQNAPVPFHPDFQFASQIESFLIEKGEYSAYDIFIKHGTESRKVFRPYRDEFSLSDSVTDKFHEIEFVEIEGMHGGLAAVGWILHHSYLGVIPQSELIRGIRLREGNIQIGTSSILSDIFPEPRFNSWSVGELHIMNRELVPTGRRDDFEVNARYADFMNRVATYGKALAKICRQKSIIRNRLKLFQIEENLVRTNLDVLGQGAISKSFVKELNKAVLVSLDKMSKLAQSEVLTEGQKEELSLRIKKLSGSISSIESKAGDTDPLEKFSPQKRNIYKNIFSLVYECSPNRVVAQGLIDKLLVRLNA